jgi:predicted dehydrogenase
VPHLDEIEYDIVTDAGNVCVRGPTKVLTELRNKDGKMVKEEFTDDMTFGVPDEFAAFASALQGSSLDSRISADEALRDLQLLEAMLESGNSGAQPRQIYK